MDVTFTVRNGDLLEVPSGNDRQTWVSRTPEEQLRWLMKMALVRGSGVSAKYGSNSFADKVKLNGYLKGKMRINVQVTPFRGDAKRVVFSVEPTVTAKVIVNPEPLTWLFKVCRDSGLAAYLKSGASDADRFRECVYEFENDNPNIENLESPIGPWLNHYGPGTVFDYNLDDGGQHLYARFTVRVYEDGLGGSGEPSVVERTSFGERILASRAKTDAGTLILKHTKVRPHGNGPELVYLNVDDDFIDNALAALEAGGYKIQYITDGQFKGSGPQGVLHIDAGTEGQLRIK